MLRKLMRVSLDGNDNIQMIAERNEWMKTLSVETRGHEAYKATNQKNNRADHTKLCDKRSLRLWGFYKNNLC